ncbi:MAG: hypothetical protein AVO35_04510 [Candidatus Aegiribacteria sp. MLS_C]|nr:MAG: hypothetical protein AVO35_04510 [Candidatus Aegiribacteria sp. MLS_C]
MYRSLAAALSMVFSALAGQVTADLTDLAALPVEILGSAESTLPMVTGGYAGARAGLPMLPSIPVTLDLPPGTEALSVESTAYWETLAADVHLPPLPDPAPLSLASLHTAAVEDPEVYGSEGFWPRQPVSLSGTGFREGSPVAELLVSPVRWDPETGELQRMTGLSVTVTTAPSSSSPVPERDTASKRMLIVTDQSLMESFELLALRRTDQGILTQVVTTDYVYSVSSGRDQAEMLRNFVKDYRASYGLDYLLLGGDVDLVPYRKAYAMTCEAFMHAREDSLPCDLYFSDLDGDWDANGNDVFGEVDDGVDLHPDIWVGRAPVENLAEAETFVSNIAAYEDCLHDDFYQNVLFLAAVLWWSPYTNSAESKELIDEEYLPGFLEITKLYEALGNENLATTMAAMNEGQNYINHNGHAWYSTLGVGDDYMSISDVDALDSDRRFGATMYSIGCWSAAFDFDAIAEHFLTNPDAGTVGYLGNSSYGWGSPGNPCYGYSDALDHLFHDLLYSDWSLSTGQLLALTKEYFIPFSQWENVYRWHQYDVNLLGDPSVRPYRAFPGSVLIECPEHAAPGTQFFPVQVTGASTEGLTLCLTDRGSNWLVTELDATGYHSFQLDYPPSDSLRITVTGPGVRRTSTAVPVNGGPQPVIAGVVIDDPGGDGMLTPGDGASLELTILNQGDQGLTDVSLEAVLESGPGSMVQSSVDFGDLPPGESSAGSGPVVVQVDSSACNGQVMNMLMQVSAAEGSWGLELSLPVCAPGLYFATYEIDDSYGGNDNGVAEPGETVDLTASIANFGLQAAETVTVVMHPCPPYINWITDSASVGSIPADGTASFLLTCQLDGSTPEPSFPWLLMDISSETAAYFSLDSLQLNVGVTGISNDVESGTAGWTHDGSGDLWNITSSQSHSASHSWHCGDAEGYDPGMNCALYSPVITLSPGAELSFWASFDTAIYGSDGLYIIVEGTEQTLRDTLDYIGSGGALGPGRGIGTGWAMWSYGLDDWNAGQTVQLEFRFVSDTDSDTGMGFYIDDMTIEGAYVGSTGSGGSSPPLPVMGDPSPNPAGNCFSVPINLTSGGRWEFSVYDISGRLVLQDSGDAPFTGLLEVDCSGLSSGIYLLRLSGEAEARGRLVILR